eukprot:COSAG06_NODE_313_length_17764_cov_4.287235_17_plen_57_part_00
MAQTQDRSFLTFVAGLAAVHTTIQVQVQQQLQRMPQRIRRRVQKVNPLNWLREEIL